MIYFKYGVEPLEFEMSCKEHDLLKAKDPQKAGKLSLNALTIEHNQF
jgi:hypothetical protein